MRSWLNFTPCAFNHTSTRSLDGERPRSEAGAGRGEGFASAGALAARASKSSRGTATVALANIGHLQNLAQAMGALGSRVAFAGERAGQLDDPGRVEDGLVNRHGRAIEFARERLQAALDQPGIGGGQDDPVE